MKKTYTSTGIVYGNLWGGGKGGYKAENLTASTKKGLLKKAQERLEDGSLDAGMGYKSLIACLLEITETTITKIKGKEFHHEEFDTEFLTVKGEKLTDKETGFLYDSFYQL